MGDASLADRGDNQSNLKGKKKRANKTEVYFTPAIAILGLATE